MPIMIDNSNAFEKLVEVEGENYRRHKTKEAFGEVSFVAVLEEWQQAIAENPALKNHRPEFSISMVGFDGIIYGDGGWNRYMVLNSGEIVFLAKSTLSKTTIDKARMAGFRIYPDDFRKNN